MSSRPTPTFEEHPMQLTTWLADYLADYRTRDLDEAIRDRARKHLLDSLIAVISGSTMRPGRLAQRFVASRSASGRATVAGIGLRTSPELASLANGMCAHSDETDDLNDLAQVHSGAAVVPAALATAESCGATGDRLLRAICAGYDVAVGINLTAWAPGVTIRKSAQAPNATGQTFGSLAAAGVISDLSPDQLRQAISYAAQQAGGITSFHRDPDHIEKAFVMGGQGSMNGVLAVEFVANGFTGVADILDGAPGFFDVWGVGGVRAHLAVNVDRRHVFNTDMKRYPVGGPILAAAQAMQEVLSAGPTAVEDVVAIEVRLPAVKAWIVDDREMPNIHVQYCLAVMLVDGDLTFANSHDVVRHHDPFIRDVMSRVTLVADTALDPPPTGEHSTRRAIVRMTLRDGRTREARVDAVLGSAANPFNWDDLAVKAHGVLANAMRPRRVDELIDRVQRIDAAPDVTELASYLLVAT